MKKVFQVIGLIGLLCFSFFMTEKTSTVVSKLDDIMMQIEANKQLYSSSSINAKIKDNTIIPGINGKEVNVKKSYKVMKKEGYYDEKLYVYDYKKPEISLSDNFDKYIISGNKDKKMVSLVFLVYDGDDITNIVNVLNNYNVKATFFVDNDWFSNNSKLIEELVSKNHTIGNLSIDLDYANSAFSWMDTVLKKIYNQNVGFCYSKADNLDNIKACALKENYTIRPNVITGSKPLNDIKNNLKAGSIIALDINSVIKRELSTIIIYIESKGYTLNSLEEHILE